MVAALLVAALWLPDNRPAIASVHETFPALQATSLDNTHFHLPQNFQGQQNLVILSFAREQQHDVDTWVQAAQPLENAHAHFRFYEVPIVFSENLLYRWWFDEALRSNTTNLQLRSRILVAYVNKHRFLQSLHISSEKQIVVLLVDSAGKISWRANGSCTGEDALALATALTSSSH